MKRDLDLIREILLQMEAAEESRAPRDFDLPDNVTQEQFGYHVWLMMDAGLITGVESKQRSRGPYAIPESLTWAGHEFLANCRPMSRWQKAKASIAVAGDISFEVLKSVLTELAKSSVRQIGDSL